MALTRIRGEQIQQRQIKQHHVIDTNDGGDAADRLIYTQLNLESSLVATDMNTSGVADGQPSNTDSIHGAVLDSKYVALWDTVLNQTATNTTSIDVTSTVEAASNGDTPTKDATVKGILTTGTGADGAGIDNYKVQIRDANTKDPVGDGSGGAVYGELTNSVVDSTGAEDGTWTLSFKNSSSAAFTMAVPQEATVTCRADDNGDLNNKYFLYDTPNNSYYIWYNVNTTGTDPNVSGRTGIAVAIATDASAADVATATASAMDAETDMGAASSTADVNITNANAGPADAPSDASGLDETGFSFEVTTAGVTDSIDFMYAEVYSILEAPYHAFISGQGFADVVGISGSHNHNELYYTKVQLESGQLDDRYYTESELNGGQLDNRYYTETELYGTDGDTAAAGNKVLDGRYYTEDEIAETADGSSGADLVGLTAYTAGAGYGYSDSTVQGALETLTDGIDDIINGDISITHSLDDAYDDGSVITVDGNDDEDAPVAGKDRVDFQLTDDYKFVVSAEAGTNEIFDISALAAGNTVEITNATFDVTGNTTLDQTTINGNLAQDTGTVTLNATGAVDIDGTAASSFATTDASLTFTTLGGSAGNLAITSGNELPLKDKHLGSPINLADASNTALSTNLDTATTIIGAINENTDDLYTLINTDLPDVTDGSSGADMIGVTGITGVIPEGGTLGADGTVQSMLEGLAKSAGGIKSYDTELDFTAAIDGTEYLPADTLVYIKENQRFAVMIIAAGDGSGNSTRGTGWEYLWSTDAYAFGGDAFKLSLTDTGADSFEVDTVGGINLLSDEGTSLADDSGNSITLNSSGAVSATSASGQTTTISTTGGASASTSDTEFDATADTIDLNGALDAAGNTDDNMVITATGTGEVQLVSSAAIDVNAPDTNVHGNMTMDATYQFSTDHINVTSVDPADFATINGYRTGTVNPANILTNSGFESGTAGDADDWTEGTYTGRTDASKYYGDWAVQYSDGGAGSAGEVIVSQAVSGLTASTAHTVSLYLQGTQPDAISVQLAGGTTTEIVAAGTSPGSWTRYEVTLPADNGASGDFIITADAGNLNSNNYFIDAVMVEEAAAASDYFSDYESTLLFTIGDEADDKIEFRSSDGTTATNLMQINQSSVRVLGDLIVDGTTTTVNSSEIDIADEQISLLSGQASGLADAFYTVQRGTDGDVALKWNETLDQWELTNDGSTYAPIATGATELTLDTAYDGGSAVTVDDTNVVWTLSAGNFQVIDGTDASKFVVTSGTGADSVKIDTSGGVDIDTDDGFRVDDVTGSYINMTNTGAVIINGASGQNTWVQATGSGNSRLDADSGSVTLYTNSTSADGIIIDAHNGGIDVDADSIAIDATAAISIDGTAASNVSATDATLTLSTLGSTTPSNLILSSVADITFEDQNQTGGALAFSQTNADGFAAEFAYDIQVDFDWNGRDTGTDAISSVLGAINANRQDLYTYIEWVATQGAEVGTAAGANLVGVDGIDGVTPTGRSEGDPGNLQEMLEGLATAGGGGGQTFASLDAFLTAKSGGTYFNADEHVRILDVNRVIRVLTGSPSTATIEGTDWDWLGGANQNFGGTSTGTGNTTPKFQIDVDDTSADGFKVNSAGGIDMDASGAVAINAGSDSNLTTTDANLTLSAAGASGNVTVSSAAGNIIVSGATLDIDGSAVDVDSTGAVNVAGNANSHFDVTGGNLSLRTFTSGNVGISAAAVVDIDGATGVTIDATAGAVALSGYDSDSSFTAYDANMKIATAVDDGSAGNVQLDSAADITFKDQRQTSAIPLTDAANGSLEYDPAETAPSSIYDAINRAYHNTGDTSRKAYFERTVDATDVSNDYINISTVGDDDLPGTDGNGNVQLAPSGLRSQTPDSYYIAVYLNGLRLNDSEWVYWYDDTDGAEKHMISFVDSISGHEYDGTFTTVTSDNVTLVSGDRITIDITVNAASNV